MKKLLFVIPTMRMGGAEKALVSLLKSLDPQRVAVDLFLFEHGGILQEQIPSWIRILPENIKTRAMTLEFRYFWRDLLRHGKWYAALTRLRMKFQPKIRNRLRMQPISNWKIASKHISKLKTEYDAAIGFLEGTADFFVIDKVHAEKKIGWIHTDFSDRTLLNDEKKLYCSFDHLVTITDLCRQAFARAVPEMTERISVIENISCADDIRDAAVLPLEESWDPAIPHILTVGRLEYHKGIDMAAAASLVLKERGVPHKWHVLGTGSMYHTLCDYVQKNGLSSVFFIDGVKSNPYPYMLRADLIVQPSRCEGKSIVLDEAKILGKAIVTTSYPSVRDQILDGITGLVVEMTPEALAGAVETILNNPVMKHRLEENCISSGTNIEDALHAFYMLLSV